MNILAIDTSTYVMGVAILRDGVPAGEIRTHLKKNHSIRLMPAIRSLFEEVDMKPVELNRIVVSEGPGSYTGVRIGVTTAKTMAWALNVPLIGVSGMEMLAQNGRYFNGVISPFYDARRGQVFTGLYRSTRDGVIRESDDRITLHDGWLKSLQAQGEPVLCVSPDMEKHKELIQQELGDLAIIGSEIDSLPSPLELARIGMSKEVVTTTHEFSPNYLRMAEAEAKWLEKTRDETKP